MQALAKCTGWQVLSSSTQHLGCGPVEPLGNATGCLLANPAGDKFVAVRHSPQSGSASVFVSSAPKKDFFATSVITDVKWSKLPDAFQEVNLDKMDGKTLLNKVRLIMSALTPLSHWNSLKLNIFSTKQRSTKAPISIKRIQAFHSFVSKWVQAGGGLFSAGKWICGGGNKHLGENGFGLNCWLHSFFRFRYELLSHLSRITFGLQKNCENTIGSVSGTRLGKKDI